MILALVYFTSDFIVTGKLTSELTSELTSKLTSELHGEEPIVLVLVIETINISYSYSIPLTNVHSVSIYSIYRQLLISHVL